jgi:hypothetical protein
LGSTTCRHYVLKSTSGKLHFKIQVSSMFVWSVILYIKATKNNIFNSLFNIPNTMYLTVTVWIPRRNKPQLP